MCGIAGIVGTSHHPPKQELLKQMLSKIKHRGPDGEGISATPKYALGHRRLSIIDLSENGSQPMMSKSKRYDLVFNGEIYNFLKLKRELSNLGQTFTSTSDTEVLLAAFESWGVDKTLNKIKGMYAIGLWDNNDNSFYLIRDRMGQKPLYYSLTNNRLIFSSELKSLTSYPDFKKDISKEALQLFFKYNYIPDPISIFEGTNKVKPGTYLRFSANLSDQEEVQFWDINKVSSNGLLNPINSKEDSYKELENTLLEVIEEQMIADVPLGAFLSGGIDSSLITSLMQSISSRPVNTFSIGFEQREFNEAEYAKDVANHLGTNHTELYVTPKETLDVIPSISQMYCEPFSDSSQIPTFLVCKMAREHVTVSLSGDGGDELFGGYNRHFWIDKIWNKQSSMPKFSRLAASGLIQTLNAKQWNSIGNLLFAGKKRSLGDKLHQVSRILRLNDREEIYDFLVSHCNIDQPILSEPVLTKDPTAIFNTIEHAFTEKMFLQDQTTYLPGDILTKVDRAAMANSLETRIPFLDQRVVELSWRIPTEHKITGTTGKNPLRHILYKHVPQNLIDRPKAGFGIPLDNWLRHDLRDWSENLLSKDRILDTGLLNYSYIKSMWDNHINGNMNLQYKLWDILVFQSWYEEFKKN